MKHKNLKYLLTISALFAATLQSGAQDAAAGGSSPVFSSLLSNLMVIATAVIVLAAFFALLQLMNAMIKMQQLKIYQEQGFEAYQEALAKPGESFWSRMYKRWTNVVPVEKEEDIMFDHNYDGIRELDNSLPPWWTALFFVTIFFAGVYLLYYHVTGMGMSSKEMYETEVKQAEEAIKAYQAKQADVIDEANLTALTDATALDAGKTIYTTNCVACHGAGGEGGVGPNLTDKFWIHGGAITDLYKTIKNGVPEKGMIAWSAQLRPADMHRVASYILTLQGTNPPNPKAPEGTEYIPGQATAPAADTTAASGTPQ